MPFYSISTLHWWNARLMPLFGIPLNALLFWLVWTKTPKEMRLHSRILLQTCCVDTMYILVTLIATPILFYHGHILVLLFDGYFTQIFASLLHFDSMCLIMLYFVYTVCFLFDIFSISVQFVYRYLVLNRNIKITLGHYLSMLTLPLILSLIVCILNVFNIGHTIGLNDELKASLKGFIDWDNSIHVIAVSNPLIWIFECFLGVTFSYSINLFCGLKVVKFLGAHGGFNPRTKALNQQLTKTLIFLALFPLLAFLIIVIILALILAMSIAGNGVEILARMAMFVQFIGSLMVEWLPVVNPVVSIWINRPYRDVVKKFFASLFKKNTDTTVHPSS